MAYASATEFRARNESAVADDNYAVALIAAADRYIDRRLGWCERAFEPISSTKVRFWPRSRPGRILHLRDAEGAAWPMRNWSVIEVDYSGSGTPDKTWYPTTAGDWIIPQPQSNTDRPYRSLRIWESHRDASESVWPCDPGVVDVTADWGWAETPDPIRELSVHVARSILDSHASGAAAVMSALESPVKLTDEGARLWRRVEMEYSAGRLGRLGLVASAGSRRR